MRGAIQWGWLQTLGDEAGDVKLVTACILAASFPALRAARIDPIVRATALCGASPELARQVGGRSGKVCSMNVATVVDLGPSKGPRRIAHDIDDEGVAGVGGVAGRAGGGIRGAGPLLRRQANAG